MTDKERKIYMAVQSLIENKEEARKVAEELREEHGKWLFDLSGHYRKVVPAFQNIGLKALNMPEGISILIDLENL